MNKEDQLQIACVNYLKYQHPGVLAFHVPNGGNRSKAEGGRFKAMGVLAGVMDILIIKSKHEYYDDPGLEGTLITKYTCGLGIELKTPTGTVRPNQKEIMAKFEKQGWIVKVCRSFDEFQKEVDDYLIDDIKIS